MIFAVFASRPSQYPSKDDCKPLLSSRTLSVLPSYSAPSSSFALSPFSGLSSFPTSYISYFPALDTLVVSPTAPISFALFRSGRSSPPTSLLASIAPPYSPQRANTYLATTRTASSRTGPLRPLPPKPSDSPSFFRESQIHFSPWTLTSEFLCTCYSTSYFSVEIEHGH